MTANFRGKFLLKDPSNLVGGYMAYRKLCRYFLISMLLITLITGFSPAQDIVSGVQSDEPLSPRIANYSMEIRLVTERTQISGKEVERKLITGKEVLTWHNTTAYEASELQFHLYYNAWRNDKSSYLSKSNRTLFFIDLSDYTENDWAYCDVRFLKILPEYGYDETNLTDTLQFIQPDDGNEHDRTVLRVPLPIPVAPGDTISLELRWESKVPRPFSRTGVRGDYYFMAQWFPKIGVFEQDGTWNCHQYIQTEYYADFGNYDVQLTVPTGWIVGATGREVSNRDNTDGTTTHQYQQNDVHDFAWTTSPHFDVITDRFQEPNLPSVDLRLLLMPDHSGMKDRYLEATKNALKYYGRWFGPYPYGHITIVDPAYGSRSGGMEYPTFFTGGTSWLSPPETRSPELVTIHEAGHNFWYGIIANNEFEDAWLDEGFNSYSHVKVMDVAYPPPVFTKRYFKGFLPFVFSNVPIMDTYSQGADNFFGYYSPLKLDRLSTPSHHYGPGSYGLNSYNKGAMMLRTLENYFGWETFQRIMSEYFDQWKFKHPRSEDFFDVVNQVSGQNMSWFFEQTYNSSNVFDYAVGRVVSNPVEEPMGYVKQNGQMVFQSREESAPEMYESIVFARRWGEAIFPVDVKVTFSDSEEIIEQWDGEERWIRFDYAKPARVVKVEVDPNHILVLDINRTNNSWVSEPKAEMASIKWAAKWMIWLQSLLEFFSFFS